MQSIDRIVCMLMMANALFCFVLFCFILFFHSCDNSECISHGIPSTVKCYHFILKLIKLHLTISFLLEKVLRTLHCTTLICCDKKQTLIKFHSCCRWIQGHLCVNLLYKNNSVFSSSSLKSPSGKERSKHCYFEWRIYSIRMLMLLLCVLIMYFVPPVFAPYENVLRYIMCANGAAFVQPNINI